MGTECQWNKVSSNRKITGNLWGYYLIPTIIFVLGCEYALIIEKVQKLWLNFPKSCPIILIINFDKSQKLCSLQALNLKYSSIRLPWSYRTDLCIFWSMRRVNCFFFSMYGPFMPFLKVCLRDWQKIVLCLDIFAYVKVG